MKTCEHKRYYDIDKRQGRARCLDCGYQFTKTRAPYQRGTIHGESYRMTTIKEAYREAKRYERLLRAVEAPAAARRMRATLKSLQGAVRHAERRVRAAEDGHPIGRGIHQGGR